MNAKLVVVMGKTTKHKVGLQLPTVLGRSREADVTVAHPLISRRHCEIFENDGLVMLRDLASLNGTMIGGRRIELAPLLPGGEFTIGPVTFRVLYEYDGDLESIPDTRFLDEVDATEAGFGDPTFGGAEDVPGFGVDEALPAEPTSVSELGELAMPDFMALADADPEEALPAGPAPAAVAATLPRPPVSGDNLPARRIADSPAEPLEVDSSLQSGGHGTTESPWAVQPQAVERPSAWTAGLCRARAARLRPDRAAGRDRGAARGNCGRR